MAEEGEVVGLQPAQEILVLGEVGRPARHQVADGIEAGAPHRPPVLDRQPHLGEHARERGGELVEQGGIGLAVDLDMHHRFGPRPLVDLAGEAQQVAVEVAPHRQHGMGQQVDADLAAIELVGDRIDQERHVVVDDLHDGMAALEAVVAEEGIEHPHLGDARQAAAGEGQQRGRGGGALLGRGRRQILVGDAAEQAAGEMGGFVASAALQGGGADGIQPVDTRRQCDGHVPVFPPDRRGRDVTPDRRSRGSRFPQDGRRMGRRRRAARPPTEGGSLQGLPTGSGRSCKSVKPEVPVPSCVLAPGPSQASKLVGVSVSRPWIPRQSAFCSPSMLHMRRSAPGQRRRI